MMINHLTKSVATSITFSLSTSHMRRPLSMARMDANLTLLSSISSVTPVTYSPCSDNEIHR